MNHFSNEYIDFFKGLSKNNNKQWFDEHKHIFEEHVKLPFHDFVEEIIIRIHQEDPNINLNPKEAIFRIYRDMRFSKDKTPYKTFLSAVISSDGRKNMTATGFYFEISADGCNIYCGSYMPDKDNLLRIRNYIAGNSHELKEIISDRNFKKLFGEILGDKAKRLPKELMEAAEKQPLIFNKQFYVHGKIEADKITSNKLSDLVMKHYLTARPFNQFLETAMHAF